MTLHLTNARLIDPEAERQSSGGMVATAALRVTFAITGRVVWWGH